MTDLISRADAIDAVAEEWLSEASAESPYVNDDDIGEYRKLAEELFEDVPSADAVDAEKLKDMKFVTIKGDKVEEAYRTGWNGAIDCVIGEYASADAVDCTDFVNWLLEKVMDEEMWELNAVAYGEIICRKLVKLGVLEVTEEPSYYIRHIENNTKPSDLVYRPSADAEQGEWDSNQACSICGCQPWYERDIHTLHYCPNCGAKMKGGDSE